MQRREEEGKDALVEVAAGAENVVIVNLEKGQNLLM